MTDFQRTAVYRAEQRADLGGEIFRDIPEAQLYADAVCEQEGVPTLTIMQGQGDRSSMFRPSQRVIRLGRGHLQEWVLIHEISHYLEHVRIGNGVKHGPTFCGTYLRLIEACLGEDAASRLRACFQMYGVMHVGTARPDAEAVAQHAACRPTTFAELKVGDDVVIDGSHLRPSSAHWAGKAGTVVKKNRSKVVIQVGPMGQRLTVEPGILQRARTIAE